MATFLVYFLIMVVNANLIIAMTETPMARKLGKHNLEGKTGISSLSPAEAPKPEERPGFSSEVSGSDEVGAAAPEQVMEILHQNHRHSFDKSVCGGGVILGGLVGVFLISIFCYIRATGRSKNAIEPESPVSSSTGRKKAQPPCSPPSNP